MEPTPNIALKVALVHAGSTSRRVAQKARIHETRFSGIVNGRIVPNLAEQRRIARALKTTVDHLFSESEAVAS
jgi:hypothetical protein